MPKKNIEDTPLLRMSIDSGAGRTKLRCGPKRASFPSVYGVVSENLDFDFAGPVTNELVFEYGGKLIAAGDSAYSRGTTAISMKHESRLETSFYPIMLAAAMAQQVQHSCDLKLVLSLPLRAYNMREQIRESLTGCFEIGVFDKRGKIKPIEINVVDIRTIPEGVGAVSCYIWDSEYKRTANAMTQPIGIVDIGTLTTDLIFLDKMTLVQAKCSSEPHGLHDIWDAIALETQNNGVAVESYRLEEIMGQGYYLQSGGHVSINGIIREWANHLATIIEAMIRTKWNGGNDAEDIIVVGGGASVVMQPLQQLLKRSINLFESDRVEPYFANCEGAWRWLMVKEATTNA